MFTAFFKSIGDSYREAQEYNKWYRENLVPKCRPFFESYEDVKSIENQKMHYQYWDEWTGGRYERVENPYLNEKYFSKYHHLHPTLANAAYKEFIKSVKMGEVLRSNPVTGYWEPLNVIHGDTV